MHAPSHLNSVASLSVSQSRHQSGVRAPRRDDPEVLRAEC